MGSRNDGRSRRAFIAGAAAAVAAAGSWALPLAAPAGEATGAGSAAGPAPAELKRELWLYRRGVASVRAPFTLDGVNIYKAGYYKLCVAFMDTSPGVDPADGYVQIDPKLIDALWEMQRYYRSIGVDQPIEIFSGFRTPATNERVGGKPKSLHKLARAVDCAIPGVSVEHTGKVALALPEWLVGGVGIYDDDGHVHLDTGPRDGRVWCNHDEHVCSASEL